MSGGVQPDDGREPQDGTRRFVRAIGARLRAPLPDAARDVLAAQLAAAASTAHDTVAPSRWRRIVVRRPVALVARLSPRERALFWLFWQTYNLWIDRDAFGRMFGVGIDAMFGAELAAATRLGLLSRGRGGYAVTARGARLYHQVEQLYTHRYIDRVWRVSRGGHGAGRLAIR